MEQPRVTLDTENFLITPDDRIVLTTKVMKKRVSYPFHKTDQYSVYWFETKPGYHIWFQWFI